MPPTCLARTPIACLCTTQVLTRENKQSYSRVLLELWVNQILDPTPGGSTLPISLPSPLHVDPSACRGLAAYGLTRVELLGSGLGHDAVDRLYRCMYVYSIGFFDVVQVSFAVWGLEEGGA